MDALLPVLGIDARSGAGRPLPQAAGVDLLASSPAYLLLVFCWLVCFNFAMIVGAQEMAKSAHGVLPAVPQLP